MNKIISSLPFLCFILVFFQGNLFAQNTLDFSGKHLDSIPTALMNDQTNGVDFSNNRMTKYPSGTFPNVRYLNLSETGISPLELTKIASVFPNLEEINLSKNNWMVLTNDILAFKKLKSIDLSHNYFTTIPSVFYSLTLLEKVNLASNDLQNNVTNIGNLWKIKEIDVRNNSNIPMEAFLGALENHDSLRKLAITMVGDKDSYKSLRTLPLTSLAVEGSDAALFSDVVFPKTLTQLQLMNTDLETANLRADAFPNIKEITCESSSVSPKMKEFKALEKLTTNTAFDPSIIKLKRLDSLFLNDDEVKPEMLKSLQTQMLKTVIVYYDNILSMDEIKENDLVSFMEKSAQEVVFPASTATQLKVENLDFSIPKNAFLNANGEVYKGNVTFSVNPIMDAAEMALLGSPMYAAVGNEEGLFSSAGMFEVQAKSDNNEDLQPNPLALIEVSMPLIQQNDAAKMYIYSEEKKNWEEMPTTVSDSSTTNMNIKLTESKDTNFLDKQKMIDSLMKSNAFKFQSNETARRNKYNLVLYSNKVKRSNTNIPSTEIRFNSIVTTPKKSYLDASGKYLSSQSWKIDTLLSPLLMHQLKWVAKNTKKIENDFLRMMRDIKVIPELENDHYRLTFYYKDSLVSLPVLPVFSSNNLAEKTAKFDKKLLRIEAKEKIALDSLRAFEERQTARMEKERYNLIVQYVNSNQTYLFEQEFKKSIGLSSFGTVNCDFFLRNKPDDYLEIPSILVTEDGKEVPVEGNVRLVLPAFNTYLEVTKEKVPLYKDKPSAAVFLINAVEIGVVVISKNRKQDLKKVNIINTSDSKPEEVALKINALMK